MEQEGSGAVKKIHLPFWRPQLVCLQQRAHPSDTFWTLLQIVNKVVVPGGTADVTAVNGIEQ